MTPLLMPLPHVPTPRVRTHAARFHTDNTVNQLTWARCACNHKSPAQCTVQRYLVPPHSVNVFSLHCVIYDVAGPAPMTHIGYAPTHTMQSDITAPLSVISSVYHYRVIPLFASHQTSKPPAVDHPSDTWRVRHTLRPDASGREGRGKYGTHAD